MARIESFLRSGGSMSKSLLTFERRHPQANVLVVTSGWPHLENETYCIFIKRQMESLIERGLRCDVLFIRGYRTPLAYPLAAIRLAAWSVFRRRRYKLVHAHSGEAALAARFYRKSPLLVSYLGDDLLGTPDANGAVSLPWRVRRWLFRQHSRLADRTITKSREMQAALPTPVQMRNTVLPNGVDTRSFRPIDRRVARRELGWDPDERVVLFAADPGVARKRYWLAEAAVEHARAALPDVRLQVAYGISPDRMPLLMNAADCLLLTSSIEGSPNVVKEALMCNLPVLATPAGDVEELVERVEPSHVCPPSPLKLADVLVEFLREPRRSNGRSMSMRLDEETIAVSLLRLYADMAPGLELEEPATGERAVEAGVI